MEHRTRHPARKRGETTMRTRLFSLCMALALCLGLLPGTALAANGDSTVYVGGVELSDSADIPAYAKTDENGKVITDGATAENYNVMWDGSTLTLKNATIKEAEEYGNSNESMAIYRQSGDLAIALVGENTVDAPGGGSAASCGINLGNGSLTISGENSASLTVYGGPTEHGNSCGIYANGAITIDSGTVTATGESASGDSYGIYTSNKSSSITVNGGTVTAESGEAQGDSVGIFAESKTDPSNLSSVTINGGTVTATAGNAVGGGWYSCGIRVEGSITITDGTVTAIGNHATETGGKKYSMGIFAAGNVTISGGDVTGIGGTGLLSIGIGTDKELEIKGGTVKAEGGTASTQFSCGFYVAASCSITGGTVTAIGGTAEQGNSSGIFAGDTTSAQVIPVTITGGTVTATGGTASNGNSSGISATNTKVDVKVTIEDATVTATGGSAGTGSYGILAETTNTEKSAEVTINGNSVVRLNTTGDNAETISSQTTTQESSIVFENGVGIVYGEVTLQEDLTVDAGESLTIPQGAALTIPDGTTLTNSGTITNDGTINNRGTLTIEPGGNLAGSGTVTGNSVEWPYTPPPANPNYRIDVTTTEGGTVTKDPAAAKAGETVTLTPAPEEGYEVGEVSVTDRFGDTVEVTEQADGTYTFTMPNGQVSVNVTFVEVQPEPLPFTDVSETDWFHDAVQYVYENGLMDGVGDGQFAPNNPTTRAQLVTILYRLEGEPAVTGQSAFTDVEPDTWYTNAVAWAAANGIVNGVSETQFAPGNNITREQLATILYRYAQAKGYDVSASADLSGFPDAGDIQSYATQALSWAVAEGLLQGFEDNSLRPQGNATRAQIATILMRFCQTVAE